MENYVNGGKGHHLPLPLYQLLLHYQHQKQWTVKIMNSQMQKEEKKKIVIMMKKKVVMMKNILKKLKLIILMKTRLMKKNYTGGKVNLVSLQSIVKNLYLMIKYN
jgi:hypothetical protein